jgi:hypothetical protein
VSTIAFCVVAAQKAIFAPILRMAGVPGALSHALPGDCLSFALC